MLRLDIVILQAWNYYDSVLYYLDTGKGDGSGVNYLLHNPQGSEFDPQNPSCKSISSGRKGRDGDKEMPKTH